MIGFTSQVTMNIFLGMCAQDSSINLLRKHIPFYQNIIRFVPGRKHSFSGLPGCGSIFETHCHNLQKGFSPTMAVILSFRIRDVIAKQFRSSDFSFSSVLQTSFVVTSSFCGNVLTCSSLLKTLVFSMQKGKEQLFSERPYRQLWGYDQISPVLVVLLGNYYMFCKQPL